VDKLVEQMVRIKNMQNRLAISAKMCIIDSMGRNLLPQFKTNILTGGGGLTNASSTRLLCPEPLPVIFTEKRMSHGQKTTD